MIDLGAYVQFDTIGRTVTTRTKSALRCSTRYVTGVAEPRHAVDGYYAPLPFKSNGGYGYDYLLTTFIPQLRQSDSVRPMWM